MINNTFMDPTRVAVLAAFVGGMGATLLLSELRWFKRIPLETRLSPFIRTTSQVGAHHRPRTARNNLNLGSNSIRSTVLPIVAAVGERLTKTLGVTDSLDIRLQRGQVQENVTQFRTRQVVWSLAAVAATAVVSATLRIPLLMALIFMLSAPLLIFLCLEQSATQSATRRQQRIFVELPVVSEQLAMLLCAGFSLGAALRRIAERNSGATGSDLRRVCERVQHGLTINAALKEWADLMAVPELSRLVAVLSLNSETAELGRLVSDEARATRQEAQRRLTEVIDRRAQQVWIPVTVATLVPGATFLMIPFIQALQAFSGS